MEYENLNPHFPSGAYAEEARNILDGFLAYADIVFYDEGELLYADDTQIDRIYMILHGVVEAYFEENGKTRIIAQMDKGAVLGATDFLARKRHASIRCKEASIVASVPISVIYSWDNDFILSLMRMQAEKTGRITMQLMNVAFNSGETRFLLLLQGYARNHLCFERADLPVCMPFSQQETADAINVSREYIAAILKKLSKTVRMVIKGDHLFYYPCDVSQALSAKKE